jgi:tetratricopeptide repeat protein
MTDPFEPPAQHPPARSSRRESRRPSRPSASALRHLIGAVALAGCALALAAPASAQSTSAQASSAQARTLFREARALMDKGRHDEACPKFEESLRLDPGIGTQFNLAHCWEQLGRTASAWGLFMDVAAAAESTGQRKRAKAAQQRAAALEPRLMRLVIDVPTPAEALRVERSGAEVGRAAWGTPMPIDPGSHHVEASAPGKRSWSQEVELQVPGQTLTVVIPALEDIAPPAPPPSLDPEPGRAVEVERDRGSGFSSWRTAGTLAMAGLGVAGVVTGTIFALRANDETEAARGLCIGGADGNVCNRDQMLPGFDGGVREQDELEQHRASANNHLLVSYVALGVGGAALLGSALLLITAPSGQREAATEASLELAPTLAPGLAGLSLSGAF